MHCTEQDLMGENVFCESLAGEVNRPDEEAVAAYPLSRAEHPPVVADDDGTTFPRPLDGAACLFKTACSRGTQGADVDGGTNPICKDCRRGDDRPCLDRLTGR